MFNVCLEKIIELLRWNCTYDGFTCTSKVHKVFKTVFSLIIPDSSSKPIRNNSIFGFIEIFTFEQRLPEINLEPLENFYGPHRYESGLMRVAFVKGNPTFAKKLMGGPLLGDTEPFRSYLLKEKIGIENWSKDFHNYTLIWRPGIFDVVWFY